MIIKTSWDDGSKEDLRLIELLKKYNLPAIFYIPNTTELGGKEIFDLSKDFEIGGHTITHPMDLKLLSDKELRNEIEGNRNWLESIIGKRVKSFCYPRGRFDERTVKLLDELDFTSARTTLVGNTFVPVDSFRIKTSAHVYPFRREYSGDHWLDFVKKMFLMAKDNGYFHLWGHSWEIEKHNLWGGLEEIFKFIKDNK